MKIDLIWLGRAQQAPHWPIGDLHVVPATPAAVHPLIRQRLEGSEADAWLFWNESAGLPDPERARAALALPGDVWHAGLRLGTGGQPGLIDTVVPTWMLNCDPPATIEATSWRLSLSACLIRTDVLRRMGDVDPAFQTLTAAALEMGHRYVVKGVLTRHVPWLAAPEAAALPREIPFEDELRFVYNRFSPFWCRWALLRAIATGYVSGATAWRAWRRVQTRSRPEDPPPYRPATIDEPPGLPDERVTVLLPTIDRYPYLRTLLTQLRAQTVPAAQIVVVDQTPPDRRDPDLARDFPDLPIHVIHREQPGQCSARNSGLLLAEGDCVLFLDDDDEIPPTLIAEHLANLRRFGAQVSSGVAEEVGAGPLPPEFTLCRASDVFPTNNTMIRPSVLARAGLFDLAYDHGQRADGDLGMRVYLSGHMMVLNPAISVLHHHAPRGGLRTHKARVVTRASSRARLTHRHLPTVSETYLAMRYFTPRQVREMLWIRAVGTLTMQSGRIHKAAKLGLGLLALPSTVWHIKRHAAAAASMLREYPKIPTWHRRRVS